MGIELRITPLNAGQPGDITALAFDEAEITIGAYNDDTVKLDRTLLQGCHARLCEQWDEDAGHYRVILTNISGASIIMVNNSPLISDEYCLIDGSSEMRMGNYLVRARSSLRDGVQSAPATSETAAPSQPIEPAPPAPPNSSAPQPSPAMQSPEPAVPESTPSANPAASPAMNPAAPAASAQPDNAPQPAPASEASSAVQPRDIPVLQKAVAAPSAHTAAPSNVTEQTAASSVAATPASPAVPAATSTPAPQAASPHAATTQAATTQAASPQASSEVASPAASPNSGSNTTMVFDDIAGNFSELSLDFDILRLCKLQGRIMHGEHPVANVIVEAGEHGHATTDLHGYFCIDGITEGSSYRLTLRHSDYQFHDSADMAGVIGDDLSLRVNAIKLIDVAGRIMHRGKPVPGIELDAGPFGRSVSDENGYYVFPRVPETARIQIRALNSGYQYKSAARGDGQTPAQNASSAAPSAHWDQQKTAASA